MFELENFGCGLKNWATVENVHPGPTARFGGFERPNLTPRSGMVCVPKNTNSIFFKKCLTAGAFFVILSPETGTAPKGAGRVPPRYREPNLDNRITEGANSRE